MWPFSNSGSPVIEVLLKPKVNVDLSSFGTSDVALYVTLTPDIWATVEWLSDRTNSALIDVIRALLFRALYGVAAYEQLLDHVRDQRRKESLARENSFENIQSNHLAHSNAGNSRGADITRSRKRSTPADVEFVGKSNVNRKLMLPHRMVVDLDRQAVKAGTDVSRYVRGLLFRELQGEVNYNQWLYARAELDEDLRQP